MNYAILLSGGVGTRMGAGLPKQYRKVNNKMLMAYTLECLANADCIDGLVIVADSEWQEEIQAAIENSQSGKDGKSQVSAKEKFLGFAQPGENRQLSIYSGLCFLRDRFKEEALDDSLVLVQDAARPNTSDELIASLMGGLEVDGENYDGAIPVLPMKDTVYVSQNGFEISALIDRATLFAGQAPEVFRFGKYLRANEALLPDRIKEINGSTEPAVLAGMKMKMIPGEESNFKITTPADFERFEALCRNRG